MSWSKMGRFYSMLLLVMTITTTTITADNSALSMSDQETALRKELFADYNLDSVPSANTNFVFAPFRLMHFNLNEAKHSMELDGWFSWRWNDPRLAWNETNYNKLTVLRVPAEKVWRPDIVLYNTVDWLNLENLGKVFVLIYPTGDMLYIPPTHLQSACIADLTHWPHDVHSCIFKLGSWTMDGTLFNITLESDQISTEDFEQYLKNKNSELSRSEWEMVSNKVTRNVKIYDCCEEEYLDITMEIVIKRNAPALAYTYKLPAVGLSFLSLFVFLLPPAAGEKLLLSCLLLLMDLQFLIHTSDVVRYSPTHIPIVVQMVGEQLTLVIVSVILTVVVLRMARSPQGEPLPSLVIEPLRTLAPFLLLDKYATLSKNYNAVHEKDEVELGDSMTTALDHRNKKEHGDWVLVAAIVDRLLFIIYFCIVISNCVAYTSVL